MYVVKIREDLGASTICRPWLVHAVKTGGANVAKVTGFDVFRAWRGTICCGLGFGLCIL